MYFADEVTWRMPFTTGAQSLLIVAYSILFPRAADIADNVALYYVARFVACRNAWTINNFAGAEKRAMGIAFMIAVGNCGGLPGSFIFLDREAPKYPTGFDSSLSFAAAGMVAAILLEFSYRSHNTRYAQVTEEEAKEKYGEAQLEKMGDKSPLFRYCY
ncbi:uncharacterized protein LTR77_009821 [Saxophila tyrrhenica]|uniref:Uncharacterized protein n=1 Tax=Saxophila tyrrhenica TaxID=1690608 RepID=A0AAV9P038_9PEZI|nr:hypothetical protein LTR77_009821 [Saxophila tyrrhenica]